MQRKESNLQINPSLNVEMYDYLLLFIPFILLTGLFISQFNIINIQLSLTITSLISIILIIYMLFFTNIN